MPGVLFWNVHMREPDSDRVLAMEDTIVDIVSENDCDIIVLAEYGADTAGLCNKLALKGKDFKERFSRYVKYTERGIRKRRNSRARVLASSLIKSKLCLCEKHYAIHHMNIAGYHFLLGAVHFPSKLYHGEEDADSIGERLHRDIQIAEKEAGHEKIILVGDFNANPFEQSIVAANRLHAIFDSSIVNENRSRRYMGDEQQLFYNPSWELLSENCVPKGSYYYSGGGRYQIYWNLYDQVIMSADFIPAFCKGSLKLVPNTKSRRFLDATGKPDVKTCSDHLPLIFNFQGVTI